MMRHYMCGSALILLLLLSGCAQSPEARRDKYLAKGKELIEKKDFSRALLEFRNAAQATPNDAEPYYQMGVAALELQDYRMAAMAFRKAVERNRKHSDAQLRLSQLMAWTAEESLLKDAQDRLRNIVGTGANAAETLTTLALTELKLGNISGAIQNLEQALAESPGELISSTMLAHARLVQKDVKGAEDVLRKAVQVAPKSPHAHRVLAQFYMAQGRLPEAETEFRQALQLDPKNGPALLDLARLQVSVSRKHEAEQTIRQLASLEPYRSAYGLYLYQEGKRDEAVREFERLVKENPDDRTVRTNLIVAYTMVNRADDANNVLSAALRKNPKDVDALAQRAEVLIQRGKYDEAEADLNKVRQLKPTAPEVHYILAKLNLARGARLSYRSELVETLRLNPTLLPVRVELAREYVNNREPRAALQLLNAAPAYQKNSTELLVQRNWAHWALREYAEMRKGIDAGLAVERSADFLLQDGLWKLQAGNASGARTALEEALRIDPTDIRALQSLARTYAGPKGLSPVALDRVKEYATQQPKSAAIQHYLGALLLAQGDRAGARKAFEMAKAADPKFGTADRALVQLDMLDGNPELARKKLEAMVASNTVDSLARMWLANVQLMTRDNVNAIANYRKVLDADPKNTDALNNMAYLMSETDQNLDEALKYAQEAVELVPENPAYCDTLGWILYRKGIYTSAVTYLERADKGNVVAKYHLAMAYAKAGDRNRSQSTLQAALKINPNLPHAKAAQAIVEESR